MELTTVASSLKKATCPEDVFGGDGGTVTDVYRQLIAVVHPDHFQGDPKSLEVANEAFTKLTTFRRAAQRKVRAGTYGDRGVEAPAEKEIFQPIAIEVKGRRLILKDKIAEGDICDVYHCVTPQSGIDMPATFKIVREGRDNDLVQNEAQILAKLFPPGAKDEKFYRFLPRMLDTFILREPGSQRRVNLMAYFPEHRPLSEILDVWPDGIDYRDMVWMFKRILHGVGFAHVNKIVHGAILPPHVMIHPVNHGAKIIDWSYAVNIEDDENGTGFSTPGRSGGLYAAVMDDFLTHPHVKAISGDYRDYYPPEVMGKKTPTAATDIYMAAKCAVALVGGDVKTDTMPDSVPKQVQVFFKRCLHKVPLERPQDAWDAHQNLEDILKTAVGPRKYRPFPMPNRV